jgi:serine/threonine protein kinase
MSGEPEDQNASNAPRVGSHLLDYYVLERLLREDEYGAVWLAKDLRIGLEIAIRILPELSFDNLEVRSVIRKNSALDHSNIARIYDFFQQRGLSCIATEYVDGQTLDSVKSRQPLGIFEVQDIKGLVLELCDALNYLHGRARLAHGNLNPSTIIVDSRRGIKLIDFGLAEMFSRLDGVRWLRASGKAARYRSPERMPGEPPRGTDDIYSLGAIIYDLLSGSPPFSENEVPSQLFASIRSINDRRMQSGMSRRPIPDNWERIVAACLSSDPRDRPRARQIATILKRGGEEFNMVAASLAVQTESKAQLSGREEFSVGAASPSVQTESKAQLQPQVIDDDVKFTVFRPRAMVPAKWTSWLFFAHRGPVSEDEVDPVAEVQRQADAILGPQIKSYADTTQESSASLPRHSTVTVVPSVEGLEFNPPQREIVWLEQVHREEFRALASARSLGNTLRGTFTVYRGLCILAQINVSVQIGEPAPESQVSVRESSRAYRNIFVSYSRRDWKVVEHFEAMIAALGDRYLRDLKDLRAGEKWSDGLEAMIREADVFQLFWSSNSMHSEYVRREWEFALSLARPNFVRPTYWEEPIPGDPSSDLPPPSLRTLHFQRLPLVDTVAAAAFLPPPPPMRMEAMSASPEPERRAFMAAPESAGRHRTSRPAILALAACLVLVVSLVTFTYRSGRNSDSAPTSGAPAKGTPVPSPSVFSGTATGVSGTGR